MSVRCAASTVCSVRWATAAPSTPGSPSVISCEPPPSAAPLTVATGIVMSSDVTYAKRHNLVRACDAPDPQLAATGFTVVAERPQGLTGGAYPTAPPYAPPV